MSDPLRPESWIQKADRNFQVIEAMLAGSIDAWDMVAFHAEQAAEVCLKGYLVAKEHREPARIHDLPALLKQCCAFDPSLAGFTSEGVLLDAVCHIDALARRTGADTGGGGAGGCRRPQRLHRDSPTLRTVT